MVVEDREAFTNELKSVIDVYFEHKDKQKAQICIKPPWYVGVLNKDMTSSGKCVIEVDIVPDYTICKENIFHTFSVYREKANKKAKGKEQTRLKQSHQTMFCSGGWQQQGPSRTNQF